MAEKPRFNPYRVLDVSREATADEIKAAFTSLAKQHHPDVNPAPGAAERFQMVKDAYDILRDAKARAEYHRTGAGEYMGPVYRDAADRERMNQRAEEFRRAYNPNANAATGAAGGGASSSAGGGTRRLVSLLEFLFMPRTVLLLAPAIAVASWLLLTKTDHSYDQQDAKVQAWFNPSTRRWETAAPWDPAFVAYKGPLARMNVRDVHVTVMPAPAQLSRLTAEAAAVPHTAASAGAASAAAAATRASPSPPVHAADTALR